MSEPITVTTILDYRARAVEEKLPLAPTVWIDAASKLNVLMGSLHDELCERQQDVAKMKLAYLQADEKRNVSGAKAKVEASDDFREYRKCELLCKRVEEFIRLAKLRSRLLAEELRGN